MRLRIGDEPLAPAALVAAARSGALDVEITPAARERMAVGHRAAEEIAAVRSVYGRTTGVGANRHVDILGDLGGHALRLLRSHAGGLGEPLPDDVVRATILVRLAQMAAGGGSRPEVAVALAGMLGAGPRADRARPRRARDRRPHGARPARPRARRRGRGRRAAAAGDRSGRRAAADELQRRHLRHRRAGVGGPVRAAGRRDRRSRPSASRRCRATARRSRARSRPPARCPA